MPQNDETKPGLRELAAVIIPTIVRIDVVDRQGGPIRTVVESPMEDRMTGGNTIDSVALFGGKVVIDRGRPDDDYETSATVIDTRSGALTYLRPSVGGADGGTIALGLGAPMKELPTSAGVLQADSLPAVIC